MVWRAFQQLPDVVTKTPFSVACTRASVRVRNHSNSGSFAAAHCSIICSTD